MKIIGEEHNQSNFLQRNRFNIQYVINQFHWSFLFTLTKHWHKN